MSACVVRMRTSIAVLAVILAAAFAMLPFIASPTAAATTAADATGPATIPAGPTVIVVDGTTVNRSIPVVSDVIGLFLDSVLNFNHGEYLNLPGYNVVINDYPRSFGLLTLGGPNYDDSVATGVAGAVSYIRLAQDGDSSVPVKLVCLSQGSDVCSQTNDELREAGYDQSNVTYILLGNVDNADGGLKVRIPYIGENGIFVPGPGVTLGNATPTTGSDATIIQVSYEYDGFARAPEYPINVLADLNAVAGTLLEHGNYTQADPYAPGNIVSTTPDGRITNIVIPVNEVPLLTLAKYVGLPQQVVDIINPALKAIIDTGYSPIPEGEGAYPTEAQPFQVLPSADKFRMDVQNVQAGLQESGDKLRESIESVLPKLPAPKVAPAPKPAVSPTVSDEPEPEPESQSAPEPKQELSASPKPKPSARTTGTKPKTPMVNRAGSNPVGQIRSTLSDVRKTVRDAVSGATTRTHIGSSDGSDKHDNDNERGSKKRGGDKHDGGHNADASSHPRHRPGHS